MYVRTLLWRPLLIVVNNYWLLIHCTLPTTTTPTPYAEHHHPHSQCRAINCVFYIPVIDSDHGSIEPSRHGRWVGGGGGRGGAGNICVRSVSVRQLLRSTMADGVCKWNDYRHGGKKADFKCWPRSCTPTHGHGYVYSIGCDHVHTWPLAKSAILLKLAFQASTAQRRRNFR